VEDCGVVNAMRQASVVLDSTILNSDSARSNQRGLSAWALQTG
jgi:hypothetical protein